MFEEEWDLQSHDWRKQIRALDHEQEEREKFDLIPSDLWKLRHKKDENSQNESLFIGKWT